MSFFDLQDRSQFFIGHQGMGDGPLMSFTVSRDSFLTFLIKSGRSGSVIFMFSPISSVTKVEKRPPFINQMPESFEEINFFPEFSIISSTIGKEMINFFRRSLKMSLYAEIKEIIDCSIKLELQVVVFTKTDERHPALFPANKVVTFKR